MQKGKINYELCRPQLRKVSDFEQKNKIPSRENHYRDFFYTFTPLAPKQKQKPRSRETSQSGLIRMIMNKFDKKFTKLTEDALHNALEYVNYSKEIDNIYIYISFEVAPFYLVFFKINNQLAFKNQLNNYSSIVYDVSDDNQKRLNKDGNEIADLIKQIFIDEKRELPTYLKMIYSPKTGHFDCKIGYEKLLDLENMVNEITIHYRWFKELGGNLQPWQKW